MLSVKLVNDIVNRFTNLSGLRNVILDPNDRTFSSPSLLMMVSIPNT